MFMSLHQLLTTNCHDMQNTEKSKGKFYLIAAAATTPMKIQLYCDNMNARMGERWYNNMQLLLLLLW